MKYLSLLLLLSLSTLCRVNSQEVTFPIKNYSTRDYGRDFHPTNMAIIQDQRGIIYAANGFKLLEFDGSRWKSYPINKETWILSLAVDSSGLIYAGSQNEFGLFEPDNRGELKYRSLSDSLDLPNTDFTNVWKVLPFSGGVVYQAEEKIFLYSNGNAEVIKPQTSFHTSFVVNDRLFVRQREIGLMEWKDTALVKIIGSELFDTTGIFFMVPYGIDGKEILIGTREKGFWLFEPDGSSNLFRQFSVDDYTLLQESVITGGILTGNGDIAISTMLNGVIIVDNEGHTKEIINSIKGLADNDVKQLLLDKSENLWLALNDGISRVEISSPLSFQTDNSGITGSVNVLLRYNNLLYAGTTTGLFVQASDNGSDTMFKPAFDLTTAVRSLVIAGGSLMAGTDEGLYRIFNNKIDKVGNEVTFTLFCLPENNLLFTGGPGGLTVYKYNSLVRKVNSLTIEGEDIIGIAGKSAAPGEDIELWLGTRYNGVLRVTVNEDFTYTSESYNNYDGLPDGWVIPVMLNSELVFETITGLYSFTDEDVVRMSVPDSLKNNKEFIKGYFSVFADIIDSIGNPVSFLTETSNKVWICSANKVGYLDKENSMMYVSKPFSGIDAGKINFIYPEENGICWIGTSDGIIRYNERIRKDYDLQYNALIRQISLIGTDSAIFSGSYRTAGPGKLRIVSDQPSEIRRTIRYKDNSVRIEFSASFFEYPGGIFYSFNLDGQDPGWSQWTRENFQEYTNLKEGNYTFAVKARNIFGTESIPAQYSFVVLPPWYRTLTAYIAYSILTILLLWLIVRLYTYRLKRENIRLEGIVTERTKEVVRQKNEIEDKNIALEHQKKEIEDSIRYAKRIQSAVIPSDKLCLDILPESFVFFRPLNIVSGDFYWISRVGRKIIFTAADCTGHGVPGAFMSMLGVAFLNEIVNKDNVTEPDMILNNLRGKVIQALQQQGISGEARDGMDIAIVTIDTEENKLGYAGAYNPLIMVRNGELIETAADKMPIGFYENMHEFRKNEITLEKGDVFYMFSDGYQDQFGGPEGKKFKTRKLKELLLEIHMKSMEVQKEIIESTFEGWKGDSPQVDDIVVVGFKIK